MKFDQNQIYQAFGFCSHFIIFGDPRTTNHVSLVKDTQIGKVYVERSGGCFDDFKTLKVVPKWVKENIVKLIRDGKINE